MDILKQIDGLFLKGVIPVAFYNSKVSKLNTLKSSSDSRLWEPYCQRNIAVADASCLVSKIYEIY